MGKGDITRTAILDAASRLATRVGLGGLSIGGLAEELELSKSGLFAHFQSKENLQLEVIAHTSTLFEERVIRAALSRPRGEPRVKALYTGWLRWGDDDVQNPGGCFYIAAATEFDDRPGPVRDALARDLKAFSQVISRAARIAVEEGQFKKGLDTDAFAQELFGIVLGQTQFRRLFGDSKARSRAEKAFEALLERARILGSHAATRPSTRDPWRQKIRRAFVLNCGPSGPGFGLLQRLSTDLAARAVLELWMTPIRQKNRGLLSDFDRSTVLSDGVAVPVWTLGNGPAVVLVHGWGGRAEQLAPIARALVAAGFRAVLFDGPGHGEAGGRTSSGPIMARALAAVVAREGEVRAVVSHSFGVVGVALALRDRLPIWEAILISPPANLRRYVDVFCRMLGVSTRVRDRVSELVPGRVGLPWSSIELPELAGKQTVPALVIHDRQDKEVDLEEGEAVSRAWPGASLTVTSGLGHWRILGDPGVAKLVVGRLSPRRTAASMAPSAASEVW